MQYVLEVLDNLELSQAQFYMRIGDLDYSFVILPKIVSRLTGKLVSGVRIVYSNTNTMYRPILLVYQKTFSLSSLITIIYPSSRHSLDLALIRNQRQSP
jgi:hypothetical protein